MKNKYIIPIYPSLLRNPYIFILNNRYLDDLKYRIIVEEYKIIKLNLKIHEKIVEKAILNVKNYLDRLNIYNSDEKYNFINRLEKLRETSVICLQFIIDNFKEDECVDIDSVREKLIQNDMNFIDLTILAAVDFYNYFENLKVKRILI